MEQATAPRGHLRVLQQLPLRWPCASLQPTRPARSASGGGGSALVISEGHYHSSLSFLTCEMGIAADLTWWHEDKFNDFALGEALYILRAQQHRKRNGPGSLIPPWLKEGPGAVERVGLSWKL